MGGLGHSLYPVILLLAASATFGAPVNDNFTNAIQLTGLTVTTTGSNVGATRESGEPTHANWGGGKSVWWKWSPSVPHTVMEVNTVGSSFDTVLAVYEAWYSSSPSVDSLRLIRSDDQGGGNNTSRLFFRSYLTNWIYYIAVDGYFDAEGNIALRLQPTPPPANDNFANAFAITALTNSVTGHNTNATGEVGEPLHNGNPYPRSVWWRWVAPNNWVVRVDSFGSYQSFSPYVTAYRGSSVSTLTRLAGADRYTWLTFQPQAGQAYYFAVDGWYGDVGRIVLNLQASPPPTNDAFAAAISITGYTNTITGDNTFATKETSEPSHSGSDAGKSLWYRWTAPTNWAVAIDSSGSAINTAIAVYTGGSLATLVTRATSEVSQVTFTATPGQTYYIAVDSSGALSRSGAFTLNLRTLRPPTNDHFLDAVPLAGTNLQVQGSLLGGRTELFEPNHEGKASVWYLWNAPRSGRVRLTCFEEVAVYYGSTLRTLTPVSRTTPLSFEYVLDAVPGNRYYIAVSGSQADEFPFTLDLTYGPANDDFVAAIPLIGVANNVQASTIGASVEFEEPTGLFNAGNSAWWSFTAPADGALEIIVSAFNASLALSVYEGSSLSNLVLKANNRVPDSDYVRCTLGCNLTGGRTYYIRAGRAEADFTFNFRFRFAPPNDAFAGQLAILPTANVAFSSTVAASREPGEPWTGSNSVWWSWTPPYTGPVILTTYGSACDTMLGVYTGNSIGALTQIATNDDCLVWTPAHPAVGWTATNGPGNDVISRVRFNANSSVPYRIAVSMRETETNKPGEVSLNITRLAIDEVLQVTRNTNANRSIPFTASLRLVNLQTNISSLLRIRLVARPGYSYRENNRINCYTENFTATETTIGVYTLPLPGTLGPGGTTQVSVGATCPPPYEAPATTSAGPEWGYGYGVVGVLEEQQGTTWLFRDARMILIGDWPKVGKFNGPGGGVILVSASLQSGGTEVGFLDINIGPPAAVGLGGAWRVSPNNYGELGELWSYTNYMSTTYRLAVRSTNFSIQTRSLNGFFSPPNQSINIQPSAIVTLNLNYSVVPPRLTFDRTRGLGISGTPQTRYRIQQVTNLPRTTWFTYTNSVTLGAGTTWFPQATNYFSNRFYRAFWLPN